MPSSNCTRRLIHKTPLPDDLEHVKAYMAEIEDFEKAAEIRDQLKDLEG